MKKKIRDILRLVDDQIITVMTTTKLIDKKHDKNEKPKLSDHWYYDDYRIGVNFDKKY